MVLLDILCFQFFHPTIMQQTTHLYLRFTECEYFRSPTARKYTVREQFQNNGCIIWCISPSLLLILIHFLTLELSHQQIINSLVSAQLQWHLAHNSRQKNRSPSTKLLHSLSQDPDPFLWSGLTAMKRNPQVHCCWFFHTHDCWFRHITRIANFCTRI